MTTAVWPPSARALRDAVMMPILLVLWTANYRVCGARADSRAAAADLACEGLRSIEW